MSLSSCTAKLGSKLNLPELRIMATAYGDLSPEAAMAKAVEDKIAELMGERQSIIDIVREEAKKRGVLKAATLKEKAVVAKPAVEEKPETSELERIDAQIARLETKQETEGWTEKRDDTITALQAQRAKLEAAKPLTKREIDKKAVAEAAEIARLEETGDDNDQNSAVGRAQTENWAKTTLQSAKTGTDLINAVLENGSRLEKALARMLEAIGVGKARVTYDDNAHTEMVRGVKSRVYGQHNEGEVRFFRGGENARVVLHELFHAVTVRQLQRAQTYLKGSESQKAATNLANDPEMSHLVSSYIALEKLQKDAEKASGWAFADVLEFVAEAMSDSKLQAVLANTRSEMTPMAPSLWQKFVTKIKQLMQGLLRVAADETGLMQSDLDGSVFARILEATTAVAREAEFRNPGSTQTSVSRNFQYSAEPMALASPGVNIFTPVAQNVREWIDKYKRPEFDHAANTPEGKKERAEWTKLHGKERFRKAKQMVSEALEWVNTQRGLAKKNPMFQKVVDTLGKMMRRKEAINTDFNNHLAVFMETMRRAGIDVEDAIRGMLESTTQKIDYNNIPEEIAKKISKWASDHMSGAVPMFTVDTETGNPILNPSYAKEVYLTKEEFIAGVKIPNQAREFKITEAMLKDHESEKGTGKASKLDEAYAGYASAMEGLIQGHLHVLKAAEDQANAMRGETTDIDAKYKGAVRSAVIDLRNRVHKAYTRLSSIDTKQRRVRQMEVDIDKAFTALETNLHGLMRGVEPMNSESTKKILSMLEVSEAEFTKLAEPIKQFIDTEVEGKQNSLAGDIRDDIYAGTHAAMIAESTALRTAQELITNYVPLRRHGKYVAGLTVEVDGKPVSGMVTMPDGSKRSTEAVLDVWMDNDRTMLEQLTLEQNTKFKENPESSKVTVEVEIWDEDAGRKKLNADGTPVTKTVTGQLKWKTPERTNEYKTTLSRISPMEFLTYAKSMGISLTPNQRAKVVKASTNADAAVRGTALQRRGTPGYSTDFVRTISDHLGSVASKISIQAYSDELQRLVSGETSWGWTENNESALKDMQKQVDEAKKKGNASKVKMFERQLNALNFSKAQIAKYGTVDIKESARKLIDFVLGSDQLEEETTWVNKTRALVTILQLGGTLASPLTNLTSIPLHAFNYLAAYNPDRAYGGGFGAKPAADALTWAFKAMLPVLAKSAAQIDPRRPVFHLEQHFADMEALAKKSADKKHGGLTLHHWEFLRKAAGDGVLSAQRFNELLAQRKHSQFGPTASKAISHYMAIFAATEEFNRIVTGLAAFDLYYKETKGAFGAKDDTNEGVNSTAFGLAYNEAIKAVYESQGEYNQANRPRLFRSDLGALVFLYKSFIVMTLELIRNLPPKYRAVFLGSVFAFSGAGGVPFWEEFMTVLDIAAQKTGVGLGITKGNAERAFTEFAREVGEDMGIDGMDKLIMQGVLDTLLGTEIFGRAGVQVGVPGIGMMRAGSDFSKELNDSFGAAGGAIEGATKAAGKIMRGDVEGAARVVPITSVRNLADAYTYAKYDAVINKRGQTVIHDPGPEDILARAIGFYPSEFKWVNEQVRREEFTKAFAKEMKSEFIEEYRQAYVMKDRARMRELIDLVRDHNQNFRGSALEILSFSESAERAGKEAILSLRERAQKTLPKAQQRDSALSKE